MPGSAGSTQLVGDASLLACVCILPSCTAFVPSTSASKEQLLDWAQGHAEACQEQPLIEAVKKAREMGAGFPYNGARLYAAEPSWLAMMDKALPSDIVVAWSMLRLDWRGAVDGN